MNVILGAWCLRAVLVDEDNDGEIDFQEFVIAMTGAQVSELSYARLAFNHQNLAPLSLGFWVPFVLLARVS